MTDSSIIQDARDVLVRVRAASTPRPWRTDESYVMSPSGGEFATANVVVNNWDVASFGGGDLAPDECREDRARADRDSFLLATDPELLDAIDSLFAWVLADPDHWVSVAGQYADAFAAAIVAANERMSA